MRASRLLSILLLLQTRGQLTAGELAEELEVSVRTVYRDVEALSEAGVPVYTERGPHGGIRLVDGYRTRLTGLTSDEAEALFLSGLPGPAAELGLGTVVAAARLKVLAALPPSCDRGPPGWASASISTRPAGSARREAAPHLQSLANAVWDDRRIRIEYDRGDRSVERSLDPLGLVIKGGVWYLVALADGQPRTYRVSRVLSVALEETRFERPDDFDLAAFWTETTAAYEARAERQEVHLRVAPDHIGALAEAIGDEAVQAAIRLEESDPDGMDASSAGRRVAPRCACPAARRSAPMPRCSSRSSCGNAWSPRPGTSSTGMPPGSHGSWCRRRPEGAPGRRRTGSFPDRSAVSWSAGHHAASRALADHSSSPRLTGQTGRVTGRRSVRPGEARSCPPADDSAERSRLQPRRGRSGGPRDGAVGPRGWPARAPAA